MTSNKTSPTFQQVVCSAPSVRDAFVSHTPLSGWWRVILFLHGKPRDPQVADVERVRCISEGFRFYACLYRVLAIIFLGVAGLLGALRGMGSEEVSAYWIGASGLGGIYLWIVSGLGYCGADAYREGQTQSIALLVCFMVMIVAFLSLFVAALSVAAHSLGWVGSGPNLLAISILFVLGVGSYLIEIIYLTTQGLP